MTFTSLSNVTRSGIRGDDRRWQRRREHLGEDRQAACIKPRLRCSDRRPVPEGRTRSLTETALIHEDGTRPSNLGAEGAQSLIPTPMTTMPTRIMMVALTAVECPVTQPFTATRWGSIHRGKRIVATMGTTTVTVAMAV